MNVSALIDRRDCNRCNRPFRVNHGCIRRDCYHCQPSLNRELPLLMRRCVFCDGEYSTRIHNQTYCSLLCGSRKQKGVKPPDYYRNCLYCGVRIDMPIVRSGRSKRYCSYECKENAADLFGEYGMNADVLAELWLSAEGRAILASIRNAKSNASKSRQMANTIRRAYAEARAAGYSKRCDVCQADYSAGSRTQRYCSDSCRHGVKLVRDRQRKK